MSGEMLPGAGGRSFAWLSRAVPTRQTLVAIIISVALLAAAAFLIWQIGSTRSDYFQRRDLRTLGLIGKDISNLSLSLSDAAELHFEPAALDFSLTAKFHCLVATAHVPTSAGRAITVSYYFIDPERAELWISKLAEEDDARLLKNGSAGAIDAGPPGPNAILPQARYPGGDRCQLGRPLGASTAPKIELREGAILAKRGFRLNQLLWPLTATAPAGAPDVSASEMQSAAPLPAKAVKLGTKSNDAEKADSSTPEVRLLKKKLVEAAQEDLRRDPLAAWSGEGDANKLAAESIDSAFRSNAIYISATLGGDPINAHGLTKRFDAVKLFSAVEADAAKGRKLLWSTGSVPPILKSTVPDGADRLLLQLLTAEPDATRPTASATATTPTTAKAEGIDIALPDASVARFGGLLIYQRDFVGPPGLGCDLATPCKLVAVRDAAAFDSKVREIDGVQATWLLIAVFTIISLLPLVQLALSKRLDPISRAGQYVLWLSLGLLTANASIGAMTLWSTSAARQNSERLAKASAEGLQHRFLTELENAVRRYSKTGSWLGSMQIGSAADLVIFPAPRELCLSPPSKWDGFIAETVMLFGADGYPVRDRPRWNVLAAPSFGANVSDRPYFQAASANEFKQAKAGPFLLDRVYSRPDGLPKTIIALPLEKLVPSRSTINLANASNRTLKCEAVSTNASRTAAPSGSSTDAQQAAATAPSPIAEDPSDEKAASGGSDGSAKSVVVVTGYLKSLLKFQPPPGFMYAVLGPPSETGADVLYHTDPGSELVERFDDDTDHPGSLADRLRRLRDGRIEPPIDTHYRARPVRLWLSPLPLNTGWTLVLIEDRNQTGYAIWREALFGYVAWALASIMAGGIAIMFFAGDRRSLDRQPNMWLWPASVLADTTPATYTADETRVATVNAARPQFNLHILLTVPMIFGVFAAYGDARIWLALTISSVVFAARGWFEGELGSDKDAAVRLDTWTSILGLVFAVIATFVACREDGTGEQAGVWRTLVMALTIFEAFLLLVWRRLPEKWHGRQFHPAWLSKVPGWAVAVILAAAAPTLAGFLDAHQSNRSWADQARTRLDCARQRDIEKQVASINRSFVPTAALTVGSGLAAGDNCAASATEPPAVPDKQGTTWSGQIVEWIGYSSVATEFATATPHAWEWPSGTSILGMVAIGTMLAGAFFMFRRQFFIPSPPTAPGPFAIDRALVVAHIHTIATEHVRNSSENESQAPKPFEYSTWRRHLLVGVGQDLIDAPETWIAGVHRFDIIDSVETVPGMAKCVIVLNFDAALLHPDTCAQALAKLKQLIDQQKTASFDLFLITGSEPLDRIVFTRDKRGSIGDDAKRSQFEQEERQWAQLLRTMALYNVERKPDTTDSPSAIDRELAVVEDLGAEKLRKAFRVKGIVNLDADQVAFITDALAEPYRLFWETSTEDERVILFLLAGGAHLKMRESFALRSLLLRRLVVRRPEYRLMNESFARFVLSIGNNRDLRLSALASDDGADQIWPLVRIPLAFLVVAGIAVLSIVVPGDVGVAAIIPAVAAALPALVKSWLNNKTAV